MDADSLYEVPLMLEKEGLANMACQRLELTCTEPDLTEWVSVVEKERNLKSEVKIALVGKYVELHDAYLSVAEALKHAGIANGAKVEIDWIHSQDVTPENVADYLKGADGILVPGGFGDRGIEGKIAAIRYARENRIPFLGICLGMQLAVVEFARHVAGLTDAHSSELNPHTPYPVIDLMPDQRDIAEMGGTMRLGIYPCKVYDDTKAEAAYQEDLIYERHRHRYEFNNQFRDILTEKGLVISGISPDERLVEIVELPEHPWFMASQFHPEFKSRPTRSHPMFREFVKASLENKGK
jgi:CTP synthase